MPGGGWGKTVQRGTTAGQGASSAGSQGRLPGGGTPGSQVPSGRSRGSSTEESVRAWHMAELSPSCLSPGAPAGSPSPALGPVLPQSCPHSLSAVSSPAGTDQFPTPSPFKASSQTLIHITSELSQPVLSSAHLHPLCPPAPTCSASEPEALHLHGLAMHSGKQSVYHRGGQLEGQISFMRTYILGKGLKTHLSS